METQEKYFLASWKKKSNIPVLGKQFTFIHIESI